MDVVNEFLAGAHEMDLHFFEVYFLLSHFSVDFPKAPMRQNLPILLGLLGIWNSTFMGHETRAILPYGQALLRFPAHIQQVCV